MKKIGFIISLLLLSSTLYAHTLLMNVMDNEDNTITVMGEFTTGQLAAGAMLRLESLVSGEVLYKKRLPESSELTVEIPKEPYQVVLDGGPNHQVVKEGVAPLEGFKKQEVNKASKNVQLSQPRSFSKEWSNPTTILFSIAFVLILLTLYFSMRNTNRIIAQIKEKN